MFKVEHDQSMPLSQRAIDAKVLNTYLGFFEGLILDEELNHREVEALCVWNDNNPTVLSNPPFTTLLPLLHKYHRDQTFDEATRLQFISVIESFKKNVHYTKETVDMQFLHGLLAGLVCDSELSHGEAVRLNLWMKVNDHLESSTVFQELFALLRPLRTKGSLTSAQLAEVKRYLCRHADPESHGIMYKVVKSEGNPDFYYGSFDLTDKIVCFTGASTHYSKAEWKVYVEERGGIFVDSMKKTVDYLVVCDKGSTAWRQVSYGSKFEAAKKLQAAGGSVLILTEDVFLG